MEIILIIVFIGFVGIIFLGYNSLPDDLTEKQKAEKKSRDEEEQIFIKKEKKFDYLDGGFGYIIVFLSTLAYIYIKYGCLFCAYNVTDSIVGLSAYFMGALIIPIIITLVISNYTKTSYETTLTAVVIIYLLLTSLGQSSSGMM